MAEENPNPDVNPAVVNVNSRRVALEQSLRQALSNDIARALASHNRNGNQNQRPTFEIRFPSVDGVRGRVIVVDPARRAPPPPGVGPGVSARPAQIGIGNFGMHMHMNALLPRRAVAVIPRRLEMDRRPAPEVIEVMDTDNNSSNSSSNSVGSNNSDVAEPCAMQIECEISEDLSDKVFENDMLREIIINHIILDNGKVSRSELKSIRLVRKSWLLTAAESLRKLRLPMFILNLDSNNSKNGCQHIQRTGFKLLDIFISSMLSPTRIPEFIPTFSLKLTPQFFRSENYKNLSDCLIMCGEALVDLDLSFPVNSSMTFAFRPFYLPKLQRLWVQFSDQRLTDLGQEPVIHNHGHTIYPLQTVLNGTEELEELVFKYTPSEALIPFGFEYLALPQTIKKLGFDCPVKNSDLQVLIKNELTNLECLRLFANNVPYSDEMILQILEKYRTSLRNLRFYGNHYLGRVRNTTLFRLPEMTRLEALTVSSQCWEFQEELCHLEKQLPNLKELRMLSTRESMFKKWTENSQFPSVQKLFVSLINVNMTSYNPHHVEVPMSLTLEKMQSIHIAFPNVVNLDITISGPQSCGLKYLFMEMRSLQKLAITVKGPSEHFHPVHWDALLIGVPRDMVMSFRKNPDYWKMVDLKDDNNFPSIRKLTALKSLALVENLCPVSPTADASTITMCGMPLISDLVFHFAFLKMVDLKNLLLHGRFMASTQMNERWKQEKRTEITVIRRGRPYNV